MSQRAVAVVLGAIAFALVLFITDPPGPGLDPDALAYLGSAESLVQHGSLRVPSAPWPSDDSTQALAHFPPAFPLAIALPVAAGMSPAQGARLIEATSAFISVSVLATLVTEAASATVAVLLVVLLAAMTSMLEVHASVLSEPMFLACMMLTLHAMVRHAGQPLRAGALAALGMMTRYAGIGLVAAVVLNVLCEGIAWKDRLRRAAIASLPAIIVQAAWVIRTRLTAGPGEIRRFAIYGNLGPTVDEGARTLGLWLVPDVNTNHDPMRYHGAIALGVALMLGTFIAMGLVWMRSERDVALGAPADGEWFRSSVHPMNQSEAARAVTAWTLLRGCALMLFCYTGVLGASRLLADPDIPLDERILAPAILLLTTVAVVTTSVWWRRTRVALARAAVACAVCTWWLGAMTSTASDARYVRDWGSDLAGHAWRNSELLEWARINATGTPLYSNWPSATYLYLHRPTNELPRKDDAGTLEEFVNHLRKNHGRVLMFNVRDDEFVSLQTLRNAPSLHIAAELRDGVVFAP